MNTRVAWVFLLAGSAVTACTYTPPEVSGSGGAGGTASTSSSGGSGGVSGSSSGGGSGEAVCGNGIEEPGEQCDDGNITDKDGCTSCQLDPAECGNGVQEAGEQCDDGNPDEGDGCDSNCTNTSCGNGIQTGNEECDDGNNDKDDGCSDNCLIEFCGDNIKQASEACDDGNTNNGDGCNSTCTLMGDSEIFVGTLGFAGSLDGTGTSARIDGTAMMAVHGDKLYLTNTHVVRVIDIPTKKVTTIAGNATAPGYVDANQGLSAQFNNAEGITTDGQTLWIGDAVNHRIRAINLQDPLFPVTTVAGSGIIAVNDGFGTAADIQGIRGMTYYNGVVYFVDGDANVLRSFEPVTGKVTTLAGAPGPLASVDGFGTAARFISPRYITSDGAGLLFISDTNGNKIRVYNIETTEVSTLYGQNLCGYVDGPDDVAIVNRPRGITWDGSSVYWAEFNAHTIRQGVYGEHSVSTLSGAPAICAYTCVCMPPGLPAVSGGYAEGIGPNAMWNFPWDVVFDPNTKSLFVSDSGNAVIRRIQ